MSNTIAYQGEARQLRRYQAFFVASRQLRKMTAENWETYYPVSSASNESLSSKETGAWDPYQWIRPENELNSNEPLGESTPIETIERSTMEIIENVPKVLNGVDGQRLADRLMTLLEICEEDAPDQAPLSRVSLADLLDFLDNQAGVNYPGTVVTFEGNIRCEWRSGPDRRFTLEFLGKDDVRFVVKGKDPKATYKIARASGKATVLSVMDLLEPYGVSELVRVAESGR